MSKKNHNEISMLLIEYLLRGNANNIGISKNPNCTTSNNPILEAENAGKLADRERNHQEAVNMMQLAIKLYSRQLEDHEEIESLKKELREFKKAEKDHSRETKYLSQKLQALSKHTVTLQKRNVKLKNTVEKLSADSKQIKRIIACISFLSGACSMSDSLNSIAHNWNKATKHECKKHSYSNYAIIDGKCKEVK